MIKELSKFDTYKLKSPMEVSIIKRGGHFYSFNNEFEIYGDGSTEDEAFESFRAQLRLMYEVSKKLVELVEDE